MYKSKHILMRIAGLPFDVMTAYNEPTLEALYRRLQQDVQSKNIIDALPYSSHDFLSFLNTFIEKNPTDFRKKDFQKARTALKYLTRTAAKSSPFASFTSIGLYDISKNIFLSQKSDNQVINLNILTIFMSILTTEKILKKALIVRKNPTLYTTESEWVWLLNHDNQEHLQRAERDETLAFFIALFDENQNISYAQLVQNLEKQVGKSKRWIAFLEQLFEVGIFEFVFPFEKNQNGFLQLKSFLSSATFVKNTKAKQALECLNTIIAQHKKAIDLPKIKQIKNTLQELNEQAIGLRAESVFFKDSATCPNFDQDIAAYTLQWQQAHRLFEDLAKITTPLHYDKLRAKIHTILHQLQVTEIDFLALYEAVFHHEFEQDNSQLNQVKNNRKKVKDWCLQSLNIQSDNIDICAKNIQSLATLTQKMKTQKMCSFATNFELILQPSTQQKAVLNGVNTATGKQYLRFAHLFDLDIIFKKKQKQYYVELNDASMLNANEHQAIADLEMDAPNSLGKQQKQSIQDWKIVNKKGNFQLQHKLNHQPIIVLDLGLEHPKFRAASYQLAAAFGQLVPDYKILSDQINSCINQQNYYLQFPRITIDNQLIIQRKFWLFPPEEVPGHFFREEKMNYAIRLLTWAKSLDLPRFVYVNIPPDLNLDDAKIAADDYKPQFIDFENPLLCDVFSKIQRRVTSTLKIEEMYPLPEHLFSIESKKHIVEIVIGKE